MRPIRVLAALVSRLSRFGHAAEPPMLSVSSDSTGVTETYTRDDSGSSRIHGSLFVSRSESTHVMRILGAPQMRPNDGWLRLGLPLGEAILFEAGPGEREWSLGWGRTVPATIRPSLGRTGTDAMRNASRLFCGDQMFGQLKHMLLLRVFHFGGWGQGGECAVCDIGTLSPICTPQWACVRYLLA